VAQAWRAAALGKGGNVSKEQAQEKQENRFGELLRRFRVSRGRSQAAVASAAGMDRSYVNRLEAGERGAPAEAAVDALAAALDLNDAEADELFAAAGYLPRSLRTLGPADPTLLLLAQRLTDPRLSAGSRAALRTAITLLAQHWAEPTLSDTNTSGGTNTTAESH
jgi:transcriptional regulator with XRE-family HTH domain